MKMTITGPLKVPMTVPTHGRCLADAPTAQLHRSRR
jgi:hypothetical protein